MPSTVTIRDEPAADPRGKPPPAATTKATPVAETAKSGLKRGLAIMGFLLRLGGIIAALGATITMATADETLPFFTQLFQFQASYDDLPTFSFFVIANAIASGYLVLSLPFSIVTIVRPQITGVKLLLLMFDTVAMALTTAAAGAAAAIVYLAHNGNSTANWVAICQQFGSFCQRVSAAVVASFVAAVVFMALVLLSALSLRRT